MLGVLVTLLCSFSVYALDGVPVGSQPQKLTVTLPLTTHYIPRSLNKRQKEAQIGLGNDADMSVCSTISLQITWKGVYTAVFLVST